MSVHGGMREPDGRVLVYKLGRRWVMWCGVCYWYTMTDTWGQALGLAINATEQHFDPE